MTTSRGNLGSGIGSWLGFDSQRSHDGAPDRAHDGVLQEALNAQPLKIGHEAVTILAIGDEANVGTKHLRTSTGGHPQTWLG